LNRDGARAPRAEGAGRLLLVSASHFVLCVGVLVFVPGMPWKIAAVFLSFVAAGVITVRMWQAHAAVVLPVVKRPPVPEQLPSVAVPMAAEPAAMDPEFLNEFREISAEADKVLQRTLRVETFNEAWAAFGDSIKRLQSNSKSIMENSKKAFDISDNLAGTAEKAFALSEQVQAKVKELTDELSQSLEETRRLFEESKKIAGILEMMSDISSKTYVLSINASVVATRAGVHGRAFDVVAKEVRKLAQETEGSLKSIEDFVNHIQQIVQSVVEHTTLTSEEIQKEKESLLSVAGALQGVILAVEIIRTVSNLSKERAEEQGTISEDIAGRTREIAARIQAQTTAQEAGDVRERIRHLQEELDRYERKRQEEEAL